MKTDDTTGVATVTFDSNDNKANRTVKVTASYQTLVKETTITVLGSRLGFGGDSSGVVGENVSMTVTLLDGAGKAIANQSVAVKSSLGNPVPATITTNASGLATLTFKPTVNGTDVINLKQEVLLKIDTDYSMATIEKSVMEIAQRLGTEKTALQNIDSIRHTLAEGKARLDLSGMNSTPVLVNFFQQSIVKELGFEIAGVFGPASLEAGDIERMTKPD